VLALTRKAGEKIFIGDNVVVQIVEIRGDGVRVAISAPKEIKIYRGEIYEQIINENKNAIVQKKQETKQLLSDVTNKI